MISNKTLLVIIPDRLSDIIKKGEFPPRYYNPGELFDQVHIVMANDDQVDLADMQMTVGRARLHLHALGNVSFKNTLGWRPFLLKPWAQKAIELAHRIQPQLIRAHGASLNGYLAAQVKKALGLPLVVSLHINFDADIRGRAPWWPSWKERLRLELHEALERETLQTADWVIPVYKPILPYTRRLDARQVKVIYNFLNGANLRQKKSYDLHHPPRIISVGRQFRAKNPDNLIRAVAETEAEFTVVGDGALHEYLKSVARECGVADRVIFRPAVPNDELCRMLPEYDLFATHSDYWEISKSVLEPLLTGLPVIINRRYPEPVPELEGDWVMLVENTKEDYLQAIRKLLDDDALRESLGRRAYAHAREHYAPQKMEQAVVALYRELVPGL